MKRWMKSFKKAEQERYGQPASPIIAFEVGYRAALEDLILYILQEVSMGVSEKLKNPNIIPILKTPNYNKFADDEVEL